MKLKLEELIEIKTSKLEKVLDGIADISDGKNYFFVKGEKIQEVVLVSHIDTVCDQYPKKVIRHGDVIFNSISPHRLGADDRAGVWICLSLLRDLGVSCLFLNGEESGATGARKACLDNIIYNKDVIKLFIEFDRQGTNHYVEYNRNPESVVKFVKSFIPKEETGTFSDIRILSDNYKIPSINISTGFYNEHREGEILILSEMNWSLMMGEKIVKNISSCPLERIEEDKFYNYYNELGMYYHNPPPERAYLGAGGTYYNKRRIRM